VSVQYPSYTCESQATGDGDDGYVSAGGGSIELSDERDSVGSLLNLALRNLAVSKSCSRLVRTRHRVVTPAS
jgi:hypothetical protein